MALRKKIGDVFVVPVDGEYKRYFQYIGDDTTELFSHLIRVFKKKYPIDHETYLQDIVNDEIDFHAHVVLPFGVRDGVWQKVGHVKDVKQVELVFKTDSFFDTSHVNRLSDREFGTEWDKVRNLSEERKKNNANWSVWRPNDKTFTFVGTLTDEYKHADFGGVFPPVAILRKIKTGKYQGWGIDD